MVRALLITHGSLGQVLLDSVQRTLGPQAEVEVLSNEGLSHEQTTALIESRLGTGPVMLFVDFCGGSPYIACQALRATHPECAVLTGVNLPMLFSFFTKRERLPFSELVETVHTDAHRGIQLSCL